MNQCFQLHSDEYPSIYLSIDRYMYISYMHTHIYKLYTHTRIYKYKLFPRKQMRI